MIGPHLDRSGVKGRRWSDGLLLAALAILAFLLGLL